MSNQKIRPRSVLADYEFGSFGFTELVDDLYLTPLRGNAFSTITQNTCENLCPVLPS